MATMLRNVNETSEGTIVIIFYPHNPSLTAREENWTRHGIFAATHYAATFFDRENMHEYYSHVELVWSGHILATYRSTQSRKPNFVR